MNQLSEEPVDHDATSRRSITNRLSFPEYRRRLDLVRRSNETEFASVARRRDPEENASGALHVDENIEAPAIWVVELYTPATISGLFDGIRRLDLDSSWIRHDQDIATWAAESRLGATGSWRSLGTIAAKSDPHWYRDGVAVLPDGIHVVLPQLMQLTPSITAFAACFVLDDEASKSICKPLRATYETWVEERRTPLRKTLRYLILGGDFRSGGGVIHSPDFQRRDLFHSRLDDLVSACAEWTSKQVPGSFAVTAPEADLPHSLLIVSESVAPHTEEAQTCQPFRVVGLDRHYEAWSSDEWPGVRMVIGDPLDRESSRLTFAGLRTEAMPHYRAHSPDPHTNWSIAHQANDMVPGLLARWALTRLLDGYHKKLARARDDVGSADRSRPVRDAKALRELARRNFYDFRLSAREIDQFAQSRAQFAHNVLEMKREPYGSTEAVDLLDSLRLRQQSRARQIEGEAELLQAALTTTADLSQVISNLRVQRLVLMITLVSAILAIVAIILAVGGPS